MHIKEAQVGGPVRPPEVKREEEVLSIYFRKNVIFYFSSVTGRGTADSNETGMSGRPSCDTSAGFIPGLAVSK